MRGEWRREDRIKAECLSGEMRMAAEALGGSVLRGEGRGRAAVEVVEVEAREINSISHDISTRRYCSF